MLRNLLRKVDADGITSKTGSSYQRCGLEERGPLTITPVVSGSTRHIDSDAIKNGFGV